ncbi:MAG: hypothetical protein DMF50_04440, partial [Acidobacteria bacterium]
VAGEGTPYLKVRRLLPGHYLQWKDGSVVLKRWWNLSQKAASLRERLPPDPARWFREVFDDAVSLRRLSDVPVGVLLSGGLDSTSVVASLAAQGARQYPTFTVRFPDVSLDEGPLARQVADSSGFQYHEMVLTPEELGDELEKASWYADEPLAHGSDVHMWAVSRHAKPQVTVPTRPSGVTCATSRCATRTGSAWPAPSWSRRCRRDGAEAAGRSWRACWPSAPRRPASCSTPATPSPTICAASAWSPRPASSTAGRSCRRRRLSIRETSIARRCTATSTPFSARSWTAMTA